MVMRFLLLFPRWAQPRSVRKLPRRGEVPEFHLLNILDDLHSSFKGGFQQQSPLHLITDSGMAYDRNYSGR
jgi:hypothetical protein